VSDAREYRALHLERYGDALMKVHLYMDAHPDKVLECVDKIVRMLSGMNEILGLKKLVVMVQDETSALPFDWAHTMLARLRDTITDICQFGSIN
jgi:hypothetical protein